MSLAQVPRFSLSAVPSSSAAAAETSTAPSKSNAKTHHGSHTVVKHRRKRSSSSSSSSSDGSPPAKTRKSRANVKKVVKTPVVSCKDAAKWRKRQTKRLAVGTRLLDLDTGALEYALHGKWKKQRAVLLVLHGDTGGADQAALIADWLSMSDHFNVLVVSRPGYLRSALATGGPAVTEAVSLVRLLNALGITRVSVLSCGTSVPAALYLAALAPSAVEKLILISVGRAGSEPPSSLLSATDEDRISDPLRLARLILPPETQRQQMQQQWPESPSNVDGWWIRGTRMLTAEALEGKHAQGLRDAVVDRLGTLVDHRVHHDSIASCLLDELSMRMASSFLRKQHADLLHLLLSIDSQPMHSSLREHHVLTHPKQMHLVQQFVTSMLPLRDRMAGVLLDLFNSELFWPACFDATSTMAFPWARVTAPTLIVQSPDDSLGSWSQAQQVQSLLRTCRLESVPDSGHLVWLGPNSKWVGQQIQGFLSARTAVSAAAAVPTLATTTTTVADPTSEAMRQLVFETFKAAHSQQQEHTTSHVVPVSQAI